MADHKPSAFRPIAKAMPTGQIAVYIGAGYAYLTRASATSLRDQLTASLAVETPKASEGQAPSCTAPELFEVQMRHWREGLRSCPPTPELGRERERELERRAMEAIQSESTP